jgi:hypothetical protein
VSDSHTLGGILYLRDSLPSYEHEMILYFNEISRNTEVALQIFVGKLEGKRLLGRPMRRR